MPLLNASEINVAALMADLPLQRNGRNQLLQQLQTLQEGLSLAFNPLQQDAIQQRYTVGEFETLPIASTRMYGSPDYWQAIAQENNLEYPYTIYPGMVLRVPNIGRG